MKKPDRYLNTYCGKMLLPKDYPNEETALTAAYFAWAFNIYRSLDGPESERNKIWKPIPYLLWKKRLHPNLRVLLNRSARELRMILSGAYHMERYDRIVGGGVSCEEDA